MKPCRQIQQQFDERLDQRLEPAAAAAFDAHMAVCPHCKTAWSRYAGAWQLLNQLPPQQPSVGFVERTMRRLDEPAESVAVVRWPAVVLWRASLIATAAAALAAAAWWGWMHWTTEQQTRLYAEIHQADFLEDFDVIAVLDELNGGGTSL